MKNFCFQRFKSLLKYDIVENGRAYAQAIGIAFLIYFFLTAFFYYVNSPIDPRDAQTFIKSSGAATFIVCIVFYFLATSNLIVNRYCEVRTATMFNMLPATNLEKGCLIILQLILFSVIVPIIFYIISYTIVYLAMLALGFGERIVYEPSLNFWSFYEQIWHQPDTINYGMELSEKDIYARWMGTIFITLLPVSFAISSTIYHIMVTYFRDKRVQIKALFAYFIFNNIVSWILTICVFTITRLLEAEGLDWFYEMITSHPGYIFYTIDFILICQIPVLAALLWWFFKRLHYKEIR